MPTTIPINRYTEKIVQDDGTIKYKVYNMASPHYYMDKTGSYHSIDITNIQTLTKMNNLTYVSLFSSAGIGCYGFKQENFDCITTCELLDKRIKIQKYNHICKNSYGYITGDISKHSIKSKIFENVDKYKKENNIKDVDVILATPPCQGISVANHKKKNELRRNSLIVDSFLILKTVEKTNSVNK